MKRPRLLRKSEKPEQIDPYETAIFEYNAVFTALSDAGMSLLRQRERSADLISLVQDLVNSIAHTPKSFESDLAEVEFRRSKFLDAEEFARRDLEAARQSAAGAGAGVAAGAAVASLAPTAAMWVATTFGTASTGTAISALSGAVATKAALAWLGGGAVAAGGGGTAAGSAVLALAGPIGWTIAGATVLTSITLFTRDRLKNRKAKQEALMAVKKNTAAVRAMEAELSAPLERTAELRERLHSAYRSSASLFGADYLALENSQQTQLGALVNAAKAAAVLLSERISEPEADDHE